MRTAAGLIVACIAVAAVATRPWIPSELISIPELGDVEQVFLNFRDDPTEMQVAWSTASEMGTTVQWGESPSSLANSASGNASTYNYGLYTSNWQHFAVMTGLETATKYYYRVGDAATGTWSDVFSFTSHPGTGASQNYVFGVIGDLGQTNFSNNTVAHVLANKDVQSVLLAGDLSYADGDQPRWDSWRRMVQPLASSTSILTAAGNHEIEWFFGSTFLPYRSRFRMPSADDSDFGSRALFFATTIGPARLVVMNSFGNFSEGSEQLAWVRKELSSIDTTQTPWVIFMEHTPLYCSNLDHQGSGKPLLDLVEDDLKALGKRVVAIAGHVHAYERTLPVYNGSLDDDAPFYITVGDAGNREGLYTKWLDPVPVWSAARKAEYGHGILRVNATTLVWEWHSIESPEPVVSDSYVRTL